MLPLLSQWELPWASLSQLVLERAAGLLRLALAMAGSLLQSE